MINFLQFLFLNKKGQQHFTLPLMAGATILAFGWIIGQRYHLFILTYENLIGYDKILHTLGGAWWALFGIALYDFNRGNFDRLLLGLDPEKNKKRAKVIILTAMSWAFVIGAGWEVLEFAWPWLRGFFPWNPLDTVMDVVWDLIGGFSIGRLYAKRLLVPTVLLPIELPIDAEVEK